MNENTGDPDSSSVYFATTTVNRQFSHVVLLLWHTTLLPQNPGNKLTNYGIKPLKPLTGLNTSPVLSRIFASILSHYQKVKSHIRWYRHPEIPNFKIPINPFCHVKKHSHILRMIMQTSLGRPLFSPAQPWNNYVFGGKHCIFCRHSVFFKYT